MALEALMAGQHFAVRCDQIKSLILGGPLLLHVAEEIPRAVFLLTYHVKVQSNRHRVLRDKANHIVVAQRALTEPLCVTSASLQGIVPGNPDENGTIFRLRSPN